MIKHQTYMSPDINVYNNKPLQTTKDFEMLILPIYSQQAEVLLFCEPKIRAINVLHNFQLPRLNSWEVLVF